MKAAQQKRMTSHHIRAYTIN